MFFAGALAVLVAYGAWEALGYVRATTGLGEFGYAFALGAATFTRVIVLVAFATVVWVPIGVWIGMNPKVTRFAQPIVQVLASFPANFIFPFATLVFVAWHIPLNFGAILLMATGGITAAGGAWNASIVAEIVSYGPHHLTATGLGAYIAEATATGNFPKIPVGIAVMSVYVVLTNRLFWRRLYALAERRYSL